jgi:hypothetical protein
MTAPPRTTSRPRCALAFSIAVTAAGCIPTPPAPPASDRAPAPGSTSSAGEILRIDFEKDPLGPYTMERLAAGGWGADSTWADGLDQGRAAVVAGDRGHALRVLYPKGSVGPSQGGAQFMLPLPGGHDALSCAYRVRFAPGFDFVRGGKLPGLVGGSHPTGGKPDDGGFSARLMWRRGGAVVQYVYHPRQTSKYGVDLPYQLDGEPVRFQPGIWHRVEHRVVMNTPGQADGVLQAWIDGRLALDARDRVWRLDATVHVDALYFSTFFGGDDPSWGAARDESVDFDDFVISTRAPGGG